ncbi:hypothetical protein N7G274_006587 [Stereocaulon virgatum]|uniref:Uncharacterized protein n=1 Tax=Stereocaulon virgatum TaxID=373712 RepID=A0ABR4A6C6_9LECA
MWKTLDGCKIQRASVAGSLLNLLNSCVLCYALRSSDRPFAASFAGISSRNHKGEELDLSKQSSFATTFESPSEKNLGIRLFSTPVTPTPQPRGRRSWLPRFEFQLPPAYEHPPFQHGFDQMALALSQTNLFTQPLPRQTTNHFSRPSYSRSYTAESPSNISRPTLSRSSSSMYSQFTNAEIDFLRDPKTASQFDHSSTRSARFRSEVAIPVPAIPERYLHKSHTLRNSGRSVRPGSRPLLPPADFWTYTQEQQKYDLLPQSQSQAQQPERRLTIWPGEDVNLQSRPQSTSPTRSKNGPHLSTKSPTRPIAAGSDSPGVVRLASPDKAVLRRNMNKGNIDSRVAGRKGSESYERLRKGDDEGRMDFERLERELSPSKIHAWKDSRTLVKMRQPRDSPPKIPVRSEARGRRL